MRFLISCVVLVLAFSAISECHKHDNIFHKLGEDIKKITDKFAHDLKRDADDIKKFSGEVENFLKSFHSDVKEAFDKAKPFLEKAYVIINDVEKSLKAIDDANELIELLEEAD